MIAFIPWSGNWVNQICLKSGEAAKSMDIENYY
jgi:hypothetical protein